MSDLIHPHPDDRALLLMKMAADRTRLGAGARLAGYEGKLERDQLLDKAKVWGLAAGVAAFVFAVVMLRGRGATLRRAARSRLPLIASSMSLPKLLRNVILISRIARSVPQVGVAIERIKERRRERALEREKARLAKLQEDLDQARASQ